MISGWFVFYAECGLASLGERLSGRLERILSGWVEEVSRFLGFLHTASHSTAIIAYLPSPMQRFITRIPRAYPPKALPTHYCGKIFFDF